MARTPVEPWVKSDASGLSGGSVTDDGRPDSMQIQRPPGVTTLRQWGHQVFLEEGKKQGQTFAQVYQDAKYRALMMNHGHLPSAWALSYQNYSRARTKVESEVNLIKAKSSEDVTWNHGMLRVGVDGGRRDWPR